jgi:peroxiredoxin (alkyl hydroperoxide reductase subunit C)
MKIPMGQKVQDFTEKAIMPDNSIEGKFNLHNYIKGKYCLLFFYPLDFTFVCPSEIIAFDNRLSEFTSRNTKVIGVSVDSHFSHLAWKNIPHRKGGIGNVAFPLVSDLNKNIANSYGIVNDDGVAYRCSVLIDEQMVIRHMTINDLPLGRNIDEMLRLIDAWDHFKENGEVCPAGWYKGKPAIEVSKSGIEDYLTSNADKL